MLTGIAKQFNPFLASKIDHAPYHELLWSETERVLYFRTTECQHKIASKRHSEFRDIDSLKSREKHFLKFIINRKAKASEVCMRSVHGFVNL